MEIGHARTRIDQLFEVKNWVELLRTLPSLIQRYPNVPVFNLAYGDVLHELKRYQEAAQQFKIARLAVPMQPAAYQREATALSADGRNDEAHIVIEVGLRVLPGNIQLLRSSIQVNWARGNRELAIERLKVLEDISPEIATQTAQNVGVVGMGKSDVARTLPANAKQRQLLDEAKSNLASRDPDAAIALLAPRYFVEPSERLAPLLDFEAGDILLVAYAMNGSFVDMISMYGEINRWTSADEYAFQLYESLVAMHGAADQSAVRALIASVIVSSGTGRLHIALKKGLEGLRNAKVGALRREDEASLLLAISQAYSFLGRRGEEAIAVDQALSLLVRHGSQASEQEAVAIALAGLSKFKRSDFVGAAKDLEVAINSLDSLGKLDSPFGASVLLERARALVMEKKYDEALALWEKSFGASRSYAMLSKRSYPRGKVGEIGRGAWILQALGNNDQAVGHWELAVKIANTWLGSGSREAISAQGALASAYLRANRKTDATQLLNSLIPKLEQLRVTGVLTEEDRQLLFSTAVGLYKDLAWLVAEEDGARSFEIAELAKARTLLDSTLLRRAKVSGVLSETDSARLQAMEDRLSQVAEKNALLRGVGKVDLELQAEQQDAQVEYREYRQSLLRMYPKFARFFEFSYPGWKAIRGRLSGNEVLVSYLVTPKSLLVYALTTDEFIVRQVPVSQETLARLVTSARAQYSNPEGGADTAADRIASSTGTPTIESELAKYLLTPIQDVLGRQRKVTIAADDVLAILPFEVLPFGNKRLVESFDVGYTQSASVLFHGRDDASVSRDHEFGILAFGGPAYESGPVPGPERSNRRGTFSRLNMARQSSTDSVSNPVAEKPLEIDLSLFVGRNSGISGTLPTAFELLRGRWTDLPGAKQEAEEVGALFPADRRKVVTGLSASEATLQQLNRSGELHKYKYLLFSTHGYLSVQEPALSAIVLSQQETTPVADGYVTASEWAGYDLRSELVVLSACETGVGKVVRGEGVTGLPYALSVAGNRSAVVSLWPVDDDATRLFMVKFFKQVRDGASIAEALSRTKNDFIQTPKFSAPVYWAPFVLYGS